MVMSAHGLCHLYRPWHNDHNVPVRGLLLLAALPCSSEWSSVSPSSASPGLPEGRMVRRTYNGTHDQYNLAGVLLKLMTTGNHAHSLGQCWGGGGVNGKTSSNYSPI